MLRFADAPEVGGSRPLVGHTRLMREDRTGFLERLAREVDRVSRLKTFGAQVVAVNHPEVLHELLVTNARAFAKSDMTRFVLRPLGGEGLFTANGELWRRQRKLMAPLFHLSQLEVYAPDMVACADRAIREWKDGEVVTLARETTRITMSIAGKTLFDADTFGEADEIGEALTAALAWTAANAPSALSIAHLLVRRGVVRAAERLPASAAAPLERLARRLEGPVVTPGALGRALEHAVARLDAQVQRMIDARRADPHPREDVLSRLLRAQGEDGAPMSDRQVRDEVLTLFVAGHETTATALAWTIHCLCRHPDVYAAVEREIDALGDRPTFADLSRLDLTLRVFKEALRIYPPVHLFARQAQERTTLDGYALERDTIVAVSPWALHRRADLWPDPERFDPDRFLPDREALRPRLAWLPFGAGPRTCIGNQFAMMEGQLVLAEMLRHVRFEPMNDEVPDPGATLRPRGGMPMRVRLRR